MKKLIPIMFFCFYTNFMNSQQILTSQIRGLNESMCNPLKVSFSINENSIRKYDRFSNLISDYQCKIEDSDFDSKGNYVEIYTPKFILDNYGIDAYSSIKKFAYRIAYDRKGGNVMYIFEFNIDSGIESGKFYFTPFSEEKFCN